MQLSASCCSRHAQCTADGNWMCHYTSPCCRPAAAKMESSGQKDTSPDLRRCYQTQQTLRPCSSCLVSSYKHYQATSEIPIASCMSHRRQSALQCGLHINSQVWVAMPVMVCQSLPNVCLCVAQPALLHILQATIQNGAIAEASCKGPLDNI